MSHIDAAMSDMPCASTFHLLDHIAPSPLAPWVEFPDKTA
jgi:hypothetical protein